MDALCHNGVIRPDFSINEVRYEFKITVGNADSNRVHYGVSCYRPPAQRIQIVFAPSRVLNKTFKQGLTSLK